MCGCGQDAFTLTHQQSQGGRGRRTEVQGGGGSPKMACARAQKDHDGQLSVARMFFSVLHILAHVCRFGGKSSLTAGGRWREGWRNPSRETMF